MTKLIFKESLDSKETIEMVVLEWRPTMKGVYAKTEEGWKMIYTNSLILWNVEEF